MYTFGMLGLLKPFTPLFVSLWLVRVAAPGAADLVYTPIRGQWVDRAVSESLSKKYGHPVVVQNAMLIKWSALYADDVRIFSPTGELLISAGPSRLSLRKMSLKKDMLFSTEIVLQAVEFHRAYYKDQSQFKPWSEWIKKPIRAKRLKLGVVQTDHFTGLSVMDCESDDVKISGYIVAQEGRIVHDRLSVQASTLKMLRKFF